MDYKEFIFNGQRVFGAEAKKPEVEYCEGKPKFKTKAEIKEYIKNVNENKGGKSFRYYRCETCGCWHLTTRTPVGEHMLRKHANKYNRLAKKSTDKKILKFYHIAN